MRLSKQFGGVGLAVIGAAVGLFAGQAVSAQPSVEMIAIDFDSGQRTFCSAGGVIDHGQAMFADGEFGFESAEAALAGWKAELRAAVTDPDIPAELRVMLTPSLEAPFVLGADSSPGVVHFDVESAGVADLEGRITVTDTGRDGWKVTETFRCMSIVVTDYEVYSQLAEEVYAR